jgi:hypothetical protein
MLNNKVEIKLIFTPAYSYLLSLAFIINWQLCLPY